MARINHNNIMMPSLRGVQKPLTSYMASNEQWIATTTTWSRNDGSTSIPMSLRGGRKTDEAIQKVIRNRLPRPLRGLAMTSTFTQTSLRGVLKHNEAIHTSFIDCHAHIRSLAMTPQGRLSLSYSLCKLQRKQ